MNGTRDFESIQQAAEALTRLSWASHDFIENQDTIMARALAFTILAERGLQHDLSRQESMLAEAMGYHDHALQATNALEREDPWKLYLQNNPELLGRLAKRANADDDSIDLWLQQLADNDHKEEWITWFRQHYTKQRAPIYAIQTSYSLRSFYPRTVGMRLMPLLVTAANSRPAQTSDKWLERIQEIAKYLPQGKMVLITQMIADIVQHDKTIRPDQVIQSIEEQLGNYNGPFLDGENYRSYYQGIYFTSLYKLGLHYLDSRSDIKQASAFGEYLVDSAHPGITELATWYKNLINADTNKVDMTALLRDLHRARHIGIKSLRRTIDELISRYRFGSTQVAGAVNLLFSRLDSRISHRFILASKAGSDLLYLSLSEKLYNSIDQYNSGQNGYLRAWLANYYDQPDDILKVVQDTNIDPSHRKKAAKLLLGRDVVLHDLKQQLLRMIDEQPDNWGFREILITCLEERKEYSEAIDVAQHWLKHSDEDRLIFDYWKAVIAISQQQLNLNNPDGAWETISAITDSWFGGALYQATKIKITMDDLDGAKEWAQRALNRYPSSQKAIMNMAEILWRQKDYAAAANLLVKNHNLFGNVDWRWVVGERFSEIFAQYPEHIPDAFVAIKTAKLNQDALANIATAVEAKKLHHAAFTILNELHYPGLGQFQLYVDAFSHLEQIDGREAAIAWLNSKIPTNKRNMSSMIFFADHQYSLLWDLIPNPEAEQYPEVVWLYRAASYAQGAQLNPQQKNALLTYFQLHTDHKYCKMGRVVLGIDNGNELLDTEMHARTLSEASYYFGLAALREEKYGDAADWFKLSTHYSSPRNGEYRWSHSLLYNWNNRAQSLSVLAKKGKLLPEAH